jgi:uncharacterized protein (TIGR02001 family)
MMKQTLIASAVAAALMVPAVSAFAEDAVAAAPAADAAPASPWTITTNVYGVSDYYFRGITQTWHKPAIQGGADFVHSDGWYAGVWGSNVSNNQFPGGSGLEFDYYGGYNGKFNDDWGWTVGGHGYMYPGANFNTIGGPDQSFDSFEVNVGASYKFMSAKYSYFVTDWFGLNQDTGFSDDTKGTSYLEFNLAYEFMPTYTVIAHAAHTNVNAEIGGHSLDYDDYLVGVSKAIGNGWVGSLSYVKANFKDTAFWKPTFSFTGTQTLDDPGSGRVILSVGRTF